jgi:large subunit ribosomal protein L4
MTETEPVAAEGSLRTPVYNMAGEQVGTVELDPAIFGIEPNLAVMHQALMRQLANARLGTHETKTRGEVSGGGRKLWRQKGTGRARQGSRRAPHWRGGGTVFGPHPRDYRQAMPRKMRRLAVRSALSLKRAEEQIVLLDELRLEQTRTKAMVELLRRLNLDGTRTLLVLPEKDEQVQRSARNIPGVKTLLAPYLNVADLLDYDKLLMPLSSLGVIGRILGPQEA